MLVFEMIIDGPGADFSRFGDLPHRNAVDAGFGDGFINDAQNFLAALECLGTSRINCTNVRFLRSACQFGSCRRCSRRYDYNIYTSENAAANTQLRIKGGKVAELAIPQPVFKQARRRER